MTMPEPKEFASAPPGEDAQNRPYTDFRNAKHHIISLVGYLIGVSKENFEHDYSPPKIEIYEELEENQDARIIRNLCRVRTALIRHYSDIRIEFRYTLKNLDSMPELIPTDAVEQLVKDGISIQKIRPDINEYLIAINKEISNRIGSCQTLFPDWLNWQYIRPLFLMPNGTKQQGIKAEGVAFLANRNKYPYQCYMNWPGKENGNILYSDEKFVTLLYEAHHEVFSDMSLVRDVGDLAQENIDAFLERSQKAVVVVDCENSNPIRLAGALSSLKKCGKDKITKVLLFDSHYTTSEWEVLSDQGAASELTGSISKNILSTILDFPIERKTVERINEHKSQVDITLVAQTCKEVYQNGVDSVVLVSSDSDYWALINSLAGVNFLVMVEKVKCGEQIKRALDSRGIAYCYLDDFYTGISYAIKITALVSSIQAYLDEHVMLNAKSLLDNALRNDWVEMTDREKEIFYDRFLKKLKAVVAQDGKIRLMLGS